MDMNKLKLPLEHFSAAIHANPSIVRGLIVTSRISGAQYVVAGMRAHALSCAPFIDDESRPDLDPRVPLAIMDTLLDFTQRSARNFVTEQLYAKVAGRQWTGTNSPSWIGYNGRAVSLWELDHLDFSAGDEYCGEDKGLALPDGSSALSAITLAKVAREHFLFGGA